MYIYVNIYICINIHIHIYMHRLLIRAVGLLKYEEDVEVLLLENIGIKFKNAIRQIRKNSINKLKKTILNNKKNTDDIESIEMKLFSEYVLKLLSCSMEILKKLLYILRLLFTSRKIRLNENIYSGYIIKENNKKAIIQIWKELEILIIVELKMHFIENDVLDISDAVDKKNRKASMSLGLNRGKQIYIC
jgi:hypothetical protein